MECTLCPANVSLVGLSRSLVRVLNGCLASSGSPLMHRQLAAGFCWGRSHIKRQILAGEKSSSLVKGGNQTSGTQAALRRRTHFFLLGKSEIRVSEKAPNQLLLRKAIVFRFGPKFTRSIGEGIPGKVTNLRSLTSWLGFSGAGQIGLKPPASHHGHIHGKTGSTAGQGYDG